MLLLFSDLHLDNYRRFSTTIAGGINSRLMKQVAVLNKVKKLSEELHPTAMIFLGDFFNGQGATINKQLYLIGYRLISKLQENIPLYMLIGNHDIFGSNHILDPMASLPNVKIIADSQIVELEGNKIGLQPWNGVQPYADVILGHLDIEGAKTGIGYPLPATMHPQEFSSCKLVISGHFHSYQEMPPNIIFCGAVMPNIFGDCEEDYGVLLLFPDLHTERVLIESPRFLTIQINSQADMDRFIENRGKNFYKLICTDRKTIIPKFDHTVEVEWDVQEEMKARLDYDVDEPLEEVLCKYIDQANIAVDKEEAKKIIREVMRETS